MEAEVVNPEGAEPETRLYGYLPDAPEPPTTSSRMLDLSRKGIQSDRARTRTALLTVFVVPSPSWPVEFSPQQRT